MRYIKKYKEKESNREPKIGDYVLIKENKITRFTLLEDVLKFIENNIGRIIDIDKKRGLYIIEYDNVPKSLILSQIGHINKEYKNCRSFFREEIKFFSPNKEKVEMQMNAERYNI